MLKHRISWERFGFAVLFGSLVSAHILGSLHSWLGFPIGRIFADADDFPFLVLNYFLCISITVVFVAVPTLLILGRVNLLRRLRGLIVSIIGTMVGAAWSIPWFGPQPPPYAEALFFAFGGLLASSFFWFVYSGANKRVEQGQRTRS
jgi:hypothetical protein